MTGKPRDSSVHHYTPRSVLRRFSIDGAGDQVWVFDKTTLRSWSAGLRSAGAEHGYNVLVGPNGESVNFEKDFDTVDAGYAEAGNFLAARRQVGALSSVLRKALADAVAAQFLRAPVVRSTLVALPKGLKAAIEEAGLAWPEDQALPADNDVRRMSRNLLGERARVSAALLAKDIVLFEPPNGGDFWVSDNPVVKFSNVPGGAVGFESLGVEIYLPIARDLMIAFLCPSILKAMTRRRLEDLAMPADKKHRLIAQRDAFLAGVPHMVSTAELDWFNAKQIEGCQRFVYSSADDFEMARALLTREPTLQTGALLIQTGRLGSAPPRPSNIPEGQWLYLEGEDRWSLVPLSACSANYRRLATTRPDILHEAMSFAPFVVATIYTDAGSATLRDVVISIVDGGVPTLFDLAFSDPVLEALDAKIREGV